MSEAAQALVGTHDFRAFAKEADRKRSCVRTIFRADVGPHGPSDPDRGRRQRLSLQHDPDHHGDAHRRRARPPAARRAGEARQGRTARARRFHRASAAGSVSCGSSTRRRRVDLFGRRSGPNPSSVLYCSAAALASGVRSDPTFDRTQDQSDPCRIRAYNRTRERLLSTFRHSRKKEFLVEITVTGRHPSITASMRSYAEDKIRKVYADLRPAGFGPSHARGGRGRPPRGSEHSRAARGGPDRACDRGGHVRGPRPAGEPARASVAEAQDEDRGTTGCCAPYGAVAHCVPRSSR